MSKRTVYDQMGQVVEFPYPPQRIVSLVPSQTEYLHALGLGDRVVGLTKFCVHPDSWRQSKIIVGGTKNFSHERIHSLEPDLIIGNKEENYIEGITELKKYHPVWMSDIYTLEDALDMMNRIGELTETTNSAGIIVQNIRKAFAGFPVKAARRCAYLIWKDPFMLAGTSTFIDDLMSRIGLVNVCQKPRYPLVTNEELRELDPELVLLSSEPYPFRANHLVEIRALLPHADSRLVDGEMFSWYGSRLIDAATYFRELNL